MATTTRTAERGVILVGTAHARPMMGIEVLEPLLARNVPCLLADPYILVYEATVPINPERAKLCGSQVIPRVGELMTGPAAAAPDVAPISMRELP